MNVTIVHSRACLGIQALPIRVEVHVSGGLPSTQIVGLPTAAVRESRDRVRAALLSAHFHFPTRRITINLAPADLPKDGSRYDLPIALGILGASGQIPATAFDHFEFLGELGLSGNLCSIDGVLPAVIAAGKDGKQSVVPFANATEAALVHSDQVYVAKTLLDVCSALTGQQPWEQATLKHNDYAAKTDTSDLSAICGQVQAKRALEIAAAGGHHLLFIGPPGCGKTLLASCLPSTLPEMSVEEALETAAISSMSGKNCFDLANWRRRPYRAPHHSASPIALVGGGAYPRPGEISLAHHGVLFLDELTEWQRKTLDMLREPLESGVIRIARARENIIFPAQFQLVAAMNPCPCGWAGDPSERCQCSATKKQHYLSRLSGPLVDRIDLQVHVPRIPAHTLLANLPHQQIDTATLRARVNQARITQRCRSTTLNAHLNPEQIALHCQLDQAEQAFLESVIDKRQLSARTAHRIIRVARTIADLEQQELIQRHHLKEAIGFRLLQSTC